jgi:DNA polymerase-1
MLLQVHVELIFECDENAIDEVAPKIKEIMEGVLTDEQSKGVPILVSGYSGKNWGGMIQLIL